MEQSKGSRMVDTKGRSKRKFKCICHKCTKFGLGMHSEKRARSKQAREAWQRRDTSIWRVSIRMRWRLEQCCCVREIATFRVESTVFAKGQ